MTESHNTEQTRLLSLPGHERRDALASCNAITVNGIAYGNSAARFWVRLLDEARQGFPACSGIELSALTPEPLDAARLHPQAELENDIQQLMGADLGEVMRQTMQELEMFGPPGPVRVRVLEGPRQLFGDDLPPDCVDTEIFTYLVVWLLEWARIPHAEWDQDSLEGQFVGRDRARRIAYHVPFDVRSAHLSEGLFRRTVVLRPIVAPSPP